MPYQLHWLAPLQVTLLELDAGFELELDAGLELEAGATLEDELFTELTTLLTAELLVVVVEQTAPVTVGFSTVPPLVFPWKPKLTDWPG